MNRSAAITATVLAALGCGIPGLGMLCLAILALIGTQMPEVVADSGAGTSEALAGAAIFAFIGIALMAVPVLTGLLTLRGGLPRPATPKDEWDVPSGADDLFPPP